MALININLCYLDISKALICCLIKERHREGEDIGLFLALVSKILQQSFLIRLLKNFEAFIEF